MTDKFILVNLEDEASKKLAEIISNKTSRKILNYLSEREASETDISKALKVPISTIHYNIKLLLENDLIKTKEFSWSEKGNKMNIYTLAKKTIIITQNKTKDIKSKLKGILPAAVISICAVGLMKIFSNLSLKESTLTRSMEASKEILTSGSVQMEAAPMMIEETSSPLISILPGYAIWFLIGALFALIVYLIWNWRKK